MQMQPAAPAASMVEASLASDSPRESVPVCLERRSIRFRKARIELLLVPGGRLRRYVVIDSARLRVALGQPKRREIDSLFARQQSFELSTSELWAMGEHQAEASLRLLYSRIAETQLAADQATPKRQQVLRPLGKVLPPLPVDGSVQGVLLYAGPTENAMFCIELLEGGRRVRTIAHLDLARALQVADARVGDTIVVAREGHHEVSIREERSGSHGSGSRTLRRGRETFKITKETPLEADSGRAPPNRSLRSASSAS
jgi:hypothetical protein